MTYTIKQQRVGTATPSAGQYDVVIPRGAKILMGRLRASSGRVVIWYISDDSEASTEVRSIEMISTDQTINSDAASAMRYLGYAQVTGDVLHIFELYYNGNGGVLDD